MSIDAKKLRGFTDKKITFVESLYIPAILKGMLITLRHFFRQKTTIIIHLGVNSVSSRLTK